MTAEERDQMLFVLKSNIGFDTPEDWVDFAFERNLKLVPAVRLVQCPDCGQPPQKVFGRYVYYSTLIRLIDCEACGLIWADARLEHSIIQQHFESAYKDAVYFANERSGVFHQLVDIVSDVTPQGGSVLDIGGATGQFLAMVSAKRPDLQLTLNDVSVTACEVAATVAGVAIRCGDIQSLIAEPKSYDTVVCSDVLYYQPNIRTTWPALARLTKPNGIVLIRIPNKALAIRGARWVRSAVAFFRGRNARSQINAKLAFFNPEHLYILRRSYVQRQLLTHSFTDIRSVPSRLLHSRGGAATTQGVFFRLASLLALVSRYRLLVTPSSVIVATRK